MKIIKNSKSNGDLTSSLVDFLDAKFRESGDQLPPSTVTDELSLQWLAPIAVRAGMEIRRKRLLETFGAMPHADFVREIEAARDDLTDALEKYRSVQNDLKNLQDDESSLHSSEMPNEEDIANTSSIQGRQRWLEKAATLRQSYGKLETILWDVATQLMKCAKFYLGGELDSNSPGAWRSSTKYTARIPLSDPSRGEPTERDLCGQTEQLLKIAAKALSEIHDLQEGNVAGLAEGQPRIRKLELRFCA